MSKLKQTIADNGGFRHWFANVFWYHYKFPVIALVIILTVVGYLTVDALRTPKYDARIAVIATRSLDAQQFSELRDVMGEALGDVNGDGQVNVLFRTANLADEEYAQEFREVFYTCLGDEDYVIYLLDDYTSALYSSSAMGYFDELAQYGLPSDTDNPCRLSLSDNVLMQQAKAEDLYLCILNHGSDSVEEEDAQRMEQAMRMVHALLGQDSE